MWGAFGERHQSIPRGIHIRYRDERLEQEAARRARSKGNKKATGGHVLRVDPAPADSDEVTIRDAKRPEPAKDEQRASSARRLPNSTLREAQKVQGVRHRA